MASQETPSTVFVADEDDAIYEDEAHGKSDRPLFKVQVIEVQVWICVVLLCILLLLLFLVNISWRIYGQSITSPPKSQEKKNVTPTSAAVRKVLSKVD